MADVANGLIKILIKIQHFFRHPCHLGFPPHFLHVTLTTPQISTRNPKLVYLPPNQISLPSLSVNPQTKSIHLLSRFEKDKQTTIVDKQTTITDKQPQKYIYTQTHFSSNSREKKSSEISISVRQRPNTQVLALSLSVYVLIYCQLYIMRRGHNVAFVYSLFGFWLYYVCLVTFDCLLVLVWVCVSLWLPMYFLVGQNAYDIAV